MLTVFPDAVAVEADLAGGRLECPGCGGRLRPWGWARARRIRDGAGPDHRLVQVRPRRTRCTGCAGTHVLLRASWAGRRADEVVVIASAIEAKIVSGVGHRRIAAGCGRPVSTVRGWLRAFAASASAIVGAFTDLIHRDGADPAGLWPAPARTLAGQALAAVTAYAAVLAERFAVVALPWQQAAMAVAGPFFFSAGRWAGGVQHELALTSGAVGGKGGQRTG